MTVQQKETAANHPFSLSLFLSHYSFCWHIWNSHDSFY